MNGTEPSPSGSSHRSSVLGGLMMVVSRKAVHSALWLALSMICLALLYIMQGAVFLGIVQIVVYTGAVMMLFLFVLMLVGVDASDSLVETLRGQRLAAVLAGLGFGLLLVSALVRTIDITPVGRHRGQRGRRRQRPRHRTADLHAVHLGLRGHGRAAGHGRRRSAMVLAHREHVIPRLSQREQSEQRTRSAHVPPLPAPGVYARHNAVDTLGLLPDGTPSELTVPRSLTQGGDEE